MEEKKQQRLNAMDNQGGPHKIQSLRMQLYIMILLFSFSFPLAASQAVFVKPLLDGSTVVSLDEGLPVGTTVLTTELRRTSFPYTVSLVSAMSGATDLQSRFSVQGHTVTTAVILDFEDVTSYIITLHFADSTGSAQVPFTLQVLNLWDEPPVLDSANAYTKDWAEEQVVGAVVFPANSFAVTDRDANDVHIYSLTGAHARYFSIDANDGTVTANTQMDREDQNAIKVFDQLTLNVFDKGGLNVSRPLTVTLTDINDNAPVCSPAVYTKFLHENTPSGILVAALICNDIDEGDNAKLYYRIVSGDTGSHFTIHPYTGKIKTSTNPLDDDNGPDTYTLVVEVSDSGTSNKLTGTAIVRVVLKAEGRILFC